MNQTLTQSLQNRTVHRTVLDNGMVVLLVENPAADIIASRIFIRAGCRCEPSHQAGLAHLLAAVLTKGTEGLSSLEIAERVESVGASLGADATADYFLLSLKTVSADFAEMLGLAGQLLRSPNFPEAEVDLERTLTLQGIRSQQEQPFAIAFEQLRRAMYPNHPYAFSSLGTETTVSKLSCADLHAYHQTYFRPDNMVISLAGRLKPEPALELVNQVFGDWQAPAVPLPVLALSAMAPEPRQIITPLQTQQSIVMLGYLAPSVRGISTFRAQPSPFLGEDEGDGIATKDRGIAGQPSKLSLSGPVDTDYAALKLLNTYLGNGLSSRLFVELREKRGLAYEVSALYPTRLDTSQFAVYMGTAPDNTATALAGLQAEVERLRSILLSDEEMQAAKNKLLGQYALGKQTNAQLAQVFGWYEILGLGIEFDSSFTEAIAGVTAQMAQQAACRYFIEPYVSLVGPAAAVTQVPAPAVC